MVTFPPARRVGLLGLCAFAACTGPVTHIDNPGAHRVFVDGLETDAQELAFRYYGTTRWDAMPTDKAGKPDWKLLPASQQVEQPWPASPWLFPLDLPLELVQRVFSGREDTTAKITLPATPPELLVEPEARPPDLGHFTARAQQARISR
ncbi:MAG TPA: hypothetical protein VF384_07925 [Planctomycetota bacterium]